MPYNYIVWLSIVSAVVLLLSLFIVVFFGEGYELEHNEDYY